jgi:hypothetical protein
MNKTLGHNERTGTRSSRKPIMQKSLAKQLYYCYDPKRKQSQQKQKQTSPIIGAEILEASIMDLNPNNIRRTYTSTSMSKKRYSYDPGKYSAGQSGGSDDEDDESGVADVDEAEVEEENLEMKNGVGNESQYTIEPFDDDLGESDIDDPGYERIAPWNQYAWLEEMTLRINGVVPSGAPMQRAHFLSQLFYGRIYRQSIPASSSRGGWLGWLWSPFLWTGSHAIGGQNYRALWDGVDGEGENVLYGNNVGNDGGSKKSFLPWMSSRAVLNRASNKP